ncbi:MAG: MerR family transcriptional regulator [Clostridium sp.]
MKLQQILELTKLSKKAIYFYIKEEFIKPTKNLENGYYNFSLEDLSKLQVIVNLRKTGMSIQDIKEVFLYPTLTNFFIHRQINNIKKNIYEQIYQLQASYYLIDGLAVNATPKDIELPLDVLCREESNNESLLEAHFQSVDSRMIAILILAPFTDIESSEYNNFLWEKISGELKLQLDNNLSNLKKLIYKLSPEQIYKTSLNEYKICKRIAEANEEELCKYEELFYESIIKLSENIELQNYWKLVYDPILVPTISFFDSKARVLLGEYNPMYTSYEKNMNRIAANVLEKLLENYSVLEKIYKCLDYKFNIKSIKYSELICMYNFSTSMYTQLELEDLKKIIN